MHLRLYTTVRILTMVVVAVLGVSGSVTAQLPLPPVGTAKWLHIGGYASAVVGYGGVANKEEEVSVTEGVLALLVSGSGWRRFSYFGEFELAGRESENFSGRRDDDDLEIERLYLEYAFDERLRLRAGRFLTPVGQWNENHANPLTWTPFRPLSTFRPFAKSLTGVTLAGETAVKGRDTGYGIYLAPSGLQRSTSEESEFVGAMGFRAATEVADNTYLGMSLINFRGSRPDFHDEEDDEVVENEEDEEGSEFGHEAGEREDDETNRALIGLDFLVLRGSTELRGEAVWLAASPLSPSEKGAFFQTSTGVAPSLFAVARVEYYEPVVSGALWIYSFGLTSRLGSRITLKLGRQLTNRDSQRVPTGWYFSASSLF